MLMVTLEEISWEAWIMQSRSDTQEGAGAYGVDGRTAGDVGTETGDAQVDGGPRGCNMLGLGLGRGQGKSSD